MTALAHILPLKIFFINQKIKCYFDRNNAPGRPPGKSGRMAICKKKIMS